MNSTNDGVVARGTTDSGNPLKIGGLAAAPDALPAAVVAAQRVDAAFDLSGRLVVYQGTTLDETNDKVRAVAEGYKATYRAAVNAHAPAATPTDWFTIQGSATKTIRINKITMAGRATAANQYLVRVSKYSVYLTGGTPAAVTMVPLDSASAAASALVQTWAGGLPTVGTLVGQVSAESIPLAVLGTPTFDTRREWKFGDANGQALVLRGIAQYASLNSNAVALPAGSVFDVTLEWTEE